MVFLVCRYPRWEESSSALARLPLKRHPDSQASQGTSYTVSLLLSPSNSDNTPTSPLFTWSTKMLLRCLDQSHLLRANLIPSLGDSVDSGLRNASSLTVVETPSPGNCPDEKPRDSGKVPPMGAYQPSHAAGPGTPIGKIDSMESLKLASSDFLFSFFFFSSFAYLSF